ncbi:hypothetical protein Cl131_gp127 [Aphanizomenon phage vB_AphaS-CL131]|nr:hypothetical protein Cl131_gp127 [Aphanizomenon phage vB_AphaS-CL131]
MVGGYSLFPAKKLTPDLVEYILSVARIQEGENICQGLKNPYTVCCKNLSPQNRTGYCKNHRSQNPEQRERVKKARMK